MSDLAEPGRIAVSGPEVIETNRGVEEFDSRDRALVWRTMGGKNRRLPDAAVQLEAVRHRPERYGLEGHPARLASLVRRRPGNGAQLLLQPLAAAEQVQASKHTAPSWPRQQVNSPVPPFLLIGRVPPRSVTCAVSLRL